MVVAMHEYKVFVEALELSCCVGLLSHERVVAQTIFVDSTLSVRCSDVDDFFCYASFVQMIKNVCLSQNYGLLETIASKICEVVFVDHRVLDISLTLRKKNALPQVYSVGISMLRKRSDFY